MSAKFSPRGTHILALGWNMNAMLYEITNTCAQFEFSHPGYVNKMTLKHGTFGAEDIVFLGTFNSIFKKNPP